MAIGQITYHIVLVPRYRYNVFYSEGVKKDCETIFNDICAEHGYRVHALEIVDDHVHMFVELHPTNSLSEVIQYLMGSSAYRLFKAHPELRKRYWGGHFWSDGKFYRSVGNVTADTIRHYITESQGKPKNSLPEQITGIEKEKPTKGQSSLDNFW